MSYLPRPLTLAIAWTLLILVLLSVPGSSVPSFSILELDKFIHAFLFLVLSVLWLQALANQEAWRAALIVGAIIVFSFLSEAYQQWLPIDRTADLLDAVADSVGALIGLFIWSIFSIVRSRQK